jgi:hypothetical protein
MLNVHCVCVCVGACARAYVSTCVHVCLFELQGFVRACVPNLL